ncbi:hypothetical protein [Streptomyces canus]|uniref:hypothetical protein n=1 Tax=Streptomyces canus TaxID=58343 RepID=UPI0030DE0AFA
MSEGPVDDAMRDLHEPAAQVGAPPARASRSLPTVLDAAGIAPDSALDGRPPVSRVDNPAGR